jgi:adenine-specific DNA-methyltransferase
VSTLADEARLAAKARGGFYTPPALTSFLVRWAVRDADARVLEPSAGDGAFMRAIVDRLAQLGQADPAERVVGIEPEAREAEKCRSAAPGVLVLERDFFELLPGDVPPMTAVVGNPPYLRFHRWNGAVRARSLERAREQGVTLSALASSWAAFVVHSTQFLTADGRLGLVLPMELLTSDYAGSVRRFLPRRFRSVLVLALDQRVFPDTKVHTVLLLASNDGPPGLRVRRVSGVDELSDLVMGDPTSIRGAVPSAEGAEAPVVDDSSPDGRWSASLNAAAALVYSELASSRRFLRLGDVASVDIGVVTGADRFFVVEPGLAQELGLPPEFLLSIIRRPAALGGLVTRTSEASLLVRIPRDDAARVTGSMRAYLDEGERLEFHRRYKCSGRRPWFSVPLPRVRPDAFFRYMNHDAARLVANDLQGWSTNLLHGVALKTGAPDVAALSASMLGSATRLSAEIEGRSYGGGVLKLETKEAERVLVPHLDASQQAALLDIFPKLDILVRSEELDTASRLVDELLGFDHGRYIAAARSFGRRRMRRSAKAN